jgi:hypothetical protein
MKYHISWDKLGIALSTLCMVHCIAVPLLIASGSLLVFAAGAQNTFHQLLFWAIAPVVLLATLPGWRRHGNRGVIAGMAFGLGLISTAAFAGEALSPSAEALLTVCGAVLLVGSHYVNLKLCQSCPVCQAGNEEKR